MIEATAHIGVMYIRVFIDQARSLKDKRMVLKSLKDRVRTQFNVSIAEVDGEDKWQTATLAVVMAGNDQRYIDSTLQHALALVEGSRALPVCAPQLEFL